MNALHIHIGEEYAVAPYGKPNGNVIIMDAIRFKAMRKFGIAEKGNKRDTMYVEGFRLDRDTGQPLSTEYQQYRCRDVIEDWEEHYDKIQQREVELKKQEEVRRQERLEYERQSNERYRRIREQRAEQERLRQEKERVTAERRDLFKQLLIDQGFPKEANIRYDSAMGTITLNLEDVEAWLSGHRQTTI